jgi:hypothetical protein
LFDQATEAALPIEDTPEYMGLTEVKERVERDLVAMDKDQQGVEMKVICVECKR